MQKKNQFCILLHNNELHIDVSLCRESRISHCCTYPKINSVWLHILVYCTTPFKVWFFFSLLTVSIWLSDLCIIHRSGFFVLCAVHNKFNCTSWLLSLILPFPLSHKSNVYSTSPYSPSHTLLLSNNVTLLRATRGCLRVPLRFHQFKTLTVAGLTYHYALTLWTSHILINWIIAIHG